MRRETRVGPHTTCLLQL